MERILLFSGLAAAAALVVVFRWPVHRRQMLFGAAFSLPIIGIELVGAGGINRFGATLAQAAASLLLNTVIVTSIGALATIAADMTVNRWLSPTIHHRRHTLGWLAIGLAAAAILNVFGWTLGLSLIVGLMINAALLIFLDRELLWDALVGATAFGLWFVIADILFGVRFSGDIQRFLLGPDPIGLTVAGLPLERLVISTMAGALLGPLFSATKSLRAAHLQRTTSVPVAKVVVGIAVTVIGVLAMAGAAVAYVLPPSVASRLPANSAVVETTMSAITVRFTRPVDRDELKLTISPAVDGTWVFQKPTFSDHGFLLAQFVFANTLMPGTRYHGTIEGVQSVWGLAGSNIPFAFTTAAVPDITSVMGRATTTNASQPTTAAGGVDPCQPITINLSKPSVGDSAFTFSFTPAVSMTVTAAKDNQSYSLQPAPCFTAGTTYTLHIVRRTLTYDALTKAVVSQGQPETLPDVPVIIAAPAPAPAVTVTPIPPVPPVPTPPAAAIPAPVVTTLPAPIQTQHILAIAEDYQDSPLSCEAAALKMALAGQGVRVSERQIMDIIGYDPALHLGNVWGDPNIAFVGNIAGRQNTTGYGVYWDPVARAANHWRTAKVITNGTPEQLAAAVYAGHPVVIWGTLGNAYRQTWTTPAGRTIQAWKGEHARTVIGVIGSADQPTSFILNDPVVGRVVWSREKLNQNWAAFNHSGVIVE